MRILSEHWKLSVTERCPYWEVRLYPILPCCQAFCASKGKAPQHLRLQRHHPGVPLKRIPQEELSGHNRAIHAIPRRSVHAVATGSY